MEAIDQQQIAAALALRPSVAAETATVNETESAEHTCCDNCDAQALIDDCQAVIARHEEQVWCSPCINSSAVETNDGTLVAMADAYTVIDHRGRDFYVAGRDIGNYYYHDGRDAYYTERAYRGIMEEEEEEREEDDGDGVIGEYHSSRYRVAALGGKGRTVGIELEIECDCDRVSRTDVAAQLTDMLRVSADNPRYCAAEEDGSLDCGFEVVTGWGGLNRHRAALAVLESAAARKILRYCRAHDTDTCGLHVHVDKSDLTPLDRGKITVFMNAPENRKLITEIARRYDSGYSQVKQKELVSSAKDAWRDGGQSDRYELVNWKPEATVEFRVFRGTIRYRTIMACAEFAVAVVEYCKQASIRELDSASFLKWISRAEQHKETAALRAYLSARGFPVVWKPSARESQPATMER